MNAQSYFISALLFFIVGWPVSGRTQVASATRQVTPSTNNDFGNFTVKPVLSAKAMKLLTESKETVVVIAMFSARPKSGVRIHYWEDNVPDNLGSKEIEVSPGQVAKFGTIVVPHDPRHRLDERAPNVLINIVSGPMSDPHNLLECDIYEGALRSATGKNIALKCKLIRE